MDNQTLIHLCIFFVLMALYAVVVSTAAKGCNSKPLAREFPFRFIGNIAINEKSVVIL